MSIINNAVDSISIGLEDFNSPDSRRLISSTRNIFAGILLLFKYKLSLLSPQNSDEVLIKQRIEPKISDDNMLTWMGSGNKTVDVQEIKKRFSSLNIDVDWARFDKINKYRNEIEHYYSTQTKSSVESLISNSFIIIQNFIVTQLDEDPKILLGKKSWEKLVTVNEVHQKEKEMCIEELEKLDWETPLLLESVIEFQCLDCGSDLITTCTKEGILCVCRSCEREYSYEEITKESLFQLYSSYNSDGAEPELTTCPFCQEESYLYYEEQCALCGETTSHECIRCGCAIPAEEISDDNLCGYCNYMHEKLMSE
jgi:hypothetical protein